MQIIFDGVTADYRLGPIRSENVLEMVDLTIPDGSFTAVIGHTGSGKSSLLKAMNGLLLPKKGTVQIGESVITAGKNKQALKAVRKKVGMVFQFPESQLFAETVEKDICFGPINFGVPLNEAKKITRLVMKQVGLPESLLSKSPFSLSGGQKRRVAIAGILAMEPDVLVLDEPGAGLDPAGKREILTLISSWHRQKKMTTVLVTHDMNDAALYADDVIVMGEGKVVLHDEVRQVFACEQILEQWHVDLPEARLFQLEIENKIGKKMAKTCLTIEELADALKEEDLA